MTEKNPTWVAGPVFRKAMEMAIEKHAGQERKADSEPYLGHRQLLQRNERERWSGPLGDLVGPEADLPRQAGQVRHGGHTQQFRSGGA